MSPPVERVPFALLAELDQPATRLSDRSRQGEGKRRSRQTATRQRRPSRHACSPRNTERLARRS